MSSSDRERVEGFQRTRSSAVTVLSAVAVTPANERVEGFQLSGPAAVAVVSAVAVASTIETTASERDEGVQHSRTTELETPDPTD